MSNQNIRMHSYFPSHPFSWTKLGTVMGRALCIWNIKRALVWISFMAFISKREGSREGKWRWQVHPPPTGRTVQYKMNFVDIAMLQCRGTAIEVAGAAKVAPRGHAEGTSRPPFPKRQPACHCPKFLPFHKVQCGPACYSGTFRTKFLFKKQRMISLRISVQLPPHPSVPKWFQWCSFHFFFFSSFQPLLYLLLQQILVEKQDVRTSGAPCTGS